MRLYASYVGLIAFFIPNIMYGAIEPTTAVLERMEGYAEQYHVSLGLAKSIVRCESGFNPYAVGPTKDHGYWQFVFRFWGKELAAKGWDIYKPEDNLEAGFWVLSQYGTFPWRNSQKCWSPLAHVVTKKKEVAKAPDVGEFYRTPSGLIVFVAS